MGRGYHRRKWDGRDWARWHDQQRSRVSSRFFGLDEDVKRIFFELTPDQLNRVIRSYSNKYGASAASYAARTYPRWRGGDVSPSADTLERLLESVPEVIPLPQKVRLLAELRKRSRKIPQKQIRCLPDTAERLVSTELTILLAQGLRHEIPPHVRAALDWLSCNSMKTAETILRVAEVLEARVLAEAASVEIVRLRLALERTIMMKGASAGRFSHRVETPYAVLDVQVAPPSLLGKLIKSSSTPPPVSDLTPRNPNDLIGELTSQLSESDKEQLRIVAAQEKLTLDVKAREASLRHGASGAEIERTLDAAERLQYGDKSSSFAVSGAYKGASGVTNIEVKRSEPAAAMIKWIAVGGAIVGLLYMCAKK
ncbi:MAG: hypothetical protein JWO05_1065 [Gemmatimonadetes bacterium]|nr:hypothetical protein [Gemmatimonadota bacterium]